MDWGEIIKGLGLALTGGFVTAIINYWISTRKENRMDFESTKNVLEKRLEQEVAEKEKIKDEKREVQQMLDGLEQKNFEIILKNERVVNELRTRLTLFESANMEAPFPMWFKDTNLIMLDFNDSYNDTFLKPRGITKSQYQNHDDFSVWEDHIAEAFRENDRWVMRNKKIFVGIEMVGTNGSAEPWIIIKFPRFAGRVLVGIAGMSFNIKDFFNTVDKGLITKLLTGGSHEN